MTRIEGSAIIPAAPEDVFRYASDWRKWAEWFEGLVIEQTPAGETIIVGGVVDHKDFKFRIILFEDER